MSLTVRKSRNTARVAAVGVLLSALWGLFFAAEPFSGVIGLPAIAAALAVRWRTAPPEGTAFSVAGGVRFALFFLRAFLAGGVDVILRAFHPRLPLRPGFVTRRLGLEPPAARLLCAATASLLPGTVSVALEGKRRWASSGRSPCGPPRPWFTAPSAPCSRKISKSGSPTPR